MTQQPPASARDAKKPQSLPDRPIEIREDENAKLRRFGGSKSDSFNNVLLNAAIRSQWFHDDLDPDTRAARRSAVLSAVGAFEPKDEIEGMIAAQAVTMHHMSMECSRRAMIPDQPTDAANLCRKGAVAASRAFIDLLGALERKRGKGSQQKVTVEHVHIHSGGQAIVGNVHAGGSADQGGRGRSSGKQEEPYRPPPALEHHAATGSIWPALRSQDPSRDALPVACDVREGAMSLARRS